MELSFDTSSFSLKLSMAEIEDEFVKRCMSFAIRHKVKQLKLDFTRANLNEDNVDFDHDYYGRFELPINVYTIDCLEYLELYSCRFLENGLSNFHALKEVSFGWMEVTTHAIKALLSNCKMLNSLSLKRCWNEEGFEGGEEEVVGLRKLVLDACHFHFGYVQLVAPCLMFFKYYGKMCHFVVEVGSLMEEAELDLSLEYEFEGHGDNLYETVERLSSVRVLTVCSYLLQVIPSGEEKLRIQRDMNVRHLIVKSTLYDNDLFGIAFMLNSCPMLERLTIELDCNIIMLQYVPPFNNVSHETFWRDTVSRYRCLRSSLKEVEVKGFKGSVNEVKVLTHLIAHGEVLKKMTINILKVDDPSGWNYRSYRHRKAQVLMEAPKASNDLEILVI